MTAPCSIFLLTLLGLAQAPALWDLERCRRLLTESKAKAGHVCSAEHLEADLLQLVKTWDLGRIRTGDRIPRTLREEAEEGQVEAAQATNPQRKTVVLYEFATLKTFRCDFTESEGRRTSAQGVTSPATRETFSDLVIDSIDYKNRTARLIGNAGSETVLVFDGERTVTFLEQTLSGNVNVLSIFKGTGTIDSYIAVFSRHSAFSTGERTVSQSYGTCRALL